MAKPKKPIVFLSHSSQDKSQLVTLKSLLDERAAGALEFFLSSDGESIEFGRNWVARISDALSQADLMFVFLSPRASGSKWIHFEAGFAHAKKVHVVPVCLPGMDFSMVTPPLSLLQGFNLHSHEAMRNLARMCNKKFEMKINESFSTEDFKRVFGALPHKAGGFFGNYSFIVEQVRFDSSIRLPETAEVNLIPKLQKIAKAARVECVAYNKTEHGQTPRIQIDLPGCCISSWEEIRNYSGEAGPVKEVSVSGSLSPDLFHLNAPVLDKWFKQCAEFTPWNVSIQLTRKFRTESERHQLTTKLYKSDIKLVGGLHFAFDGLAFELSPHAFNAISFKSKGTLNDKRLPKLIERLSTLNVLIDAPVPSDFENSLSGYLARSRLI